MNKKMKKTVLVVDDEQPMCEKLQRRFLYCNQMADCPYEFAIDVAQSAAECIQKVRARTADGVVLPYDVIVLDIRMEKEMSGLEASLMLAQELGQEIPVRIIFTGHKPSIEQCIKAMRHGTWDYIAKEDTGDIPAAQLVVNSALARLQELDLRRKQKQQIAADWLPQHLWELQPEYGGKLVALWHQPEGQPEVTVIASGADAFELEEHLQGWRKQHAAWEQPFIVRIPLT